MSANIKITGDFKSVKSGFKELEKTVEDVGKKKIGINLDKGTINTAKETIKKVFKDIEESNKSLTNEINKLGKELEKAVDPRKIKELRKEVVGLGREIASNNRALNSGAGSAFGGGGNAGGGGGGSSGGGGSMFGGGMGRMLKGGVYGAAAGAAIGLALKTFAPAMEAAQGRLGLRSLGLSAGGITGVESGGLRYGQKGGESRQLAATLMRLTGSASSTGRVQELSMLSGAGGDEIAGVMGGLRKTGMSSNQSIKMLKDVYTEAIANGFDESRVFDVMKTMSDNVEALSQNGANPLAIKDIMMGLMGSSKFFRDDASRAGQVMQSVEGKFTGGGPGAALAYRTLRGMGGQYSKMSPIQLIEQAGLGITGMGGAGKEGYNAYLEQIASQSLGKKFKIGDKLNEQERSTLSVGGFRDFLGLSPNAAKELSYSVQNGDSADIGKKLLESTKTADQKLLDLLADKNTGLLGIAATLDAIKTELSTSIAGTLKGLDTNLQDILTGLKPVFEGLEKASNLVSPSGALNFGVPGMLNKIKGKWSELHPGNNSWGAMQNAAGGTAPAAPTVGAFDQNLLGASPVNTSMLKFKSKNIENSFYKMNPHSQSLAAYASKLTGIAQTITSGFRTKEENDAAGGAKHSGHLRGDDFDVRISDLSPVQIKSLMEAYNSQPGVNAAIHGNDHIHVSNRSKIKNQIIAGTEGGPRVISGSGIKPEEQPVYDTVNAFVDQMKKTVDKGMIYPSRVYGLSGVKKMKN